LPVRREEAEVHHAMDQELLAEPGVKSYEMRSVSRDGATTSTKRPRSRPRTEVWAALSASS
jgi:hypothetical protein